MSRITETQLAERWGVTTRTLQLWRKNGQGPAFVRIGPKSVFYREADIEAYEDACTVNRRPGFKSTIRRAAGALDLLAQQSKSDKARTTLSTLRDELRSLI